MSKKAKNIDRNKVMTALTDYACFLLDTPEPSMGDEKVYDSRRKALHKKIAEVLGCPMDGSVDLDTWWHKNDATLSEDLKTWKKSGFDKLEQFIEWRVDRLIDGVENDVYDSAHIKTDYAFKHRIKIVFNYWKNVYKKRMKAANDVLQAAHSDWVAWYDFNYKDKKNKKGDPLKCPVCPWDLNIHDFNGYRSSIDFCYRQIEQLIQLPKEAYLKSVVQQYYYDNIDTISKHVNKCEGIAFCAMQIHKKAVYFGWAEKVKEMKKVDDNEVKDDLIKPPVKGNDGN